MRDFLFFMSALRAEIFQILSKIKQLNFVYIC